MNLAVRILELLAVAVFVALLWPAVKPRRTRRRWSTSASDRGGYLEVRK